MSVPPEPSFDEFFHAQQADRRSSSANSTGSFHQHLNAVNAQPNNNNNPFITDHVYEEPGQLHRRGSNASMRSMRERTESSASVTGRMQGIHVGGSPVPGHPNHQRAGSQTGRLMAEHAQRQDSFPFDPENSSTLIATAPKGGPKQSPPAHANGQYQSIGDIMFSRRDNQPSPLPQQQYAPPQPQQQYEQWAQYPPQGLPGQYDPGSAGLEIPHSGGSDSFMYQQNSPFSVSDMGNTPQSGWEQEFINSNGAANPDPTQWNGENMLMSDQEQFNELERMFVSCHWFYSDTDQQYLECLFALGNPVRPTHGSSAKLHTRFKLRSSCWLSERLWIREPFRAASSYSFSSTKLSFCCFRLAVPKQSAITACSHHPGSAIERITRTPAHQHNESKQPSSTRDHAQRLGHFERCWGTLASCKSCS